MKTIYISAMALAFAGTVACNQRNTTDTSSNDRRTTPDATLKGEQRGADAARPISLTGCLQRGDRNTFIVTRLNEPTERGVGTTGNGAAVEREQLREANSAYRVEPQDKTDLE